MGVPYRLGAYHGGQKSHLVHRKYPDIFWCGRSAVPSTPRDDWWMVVDDRKNPQICGDCKAGDRSAVRADWEREKRLKSKGSIPYDREVTLDELYETARELFPMEIGNPFL